MFAKTIAALKGVEAAAQEELDALWVPFDRETGTGGVHWNAQGSGILGDTLSQIRALRTSLEPRQAAHEEAQAAAEAAAAAAAPTQAEIDATDTALEHAKAEGVDITTIKGTGAGGRITKADVQKAVAEKEAANA